MLIEPVEMASIGVDGVLLAEAHDRALAELLLDLADGQLDGLQRARGRCGLLLTGGIAVKLLA